MSSIFSSVFSRKAQRDTVNEPSGESMVDWAKVNPTSFAEQDGAGLPTTAGRSTEPTQNNMFSILYGEMQALTPDFDIEILKLCSYMAKCNGDISYAIDNVVQLGNTPSVISFDESVKPDQAKNMLAFLAESENKIYTGGMNSLQNDLFAQVAQTGAISAELIPTRVLDGVRRCVIVNPYPIRFKYNPTTYEFDPYQKVNDILAVGDGGLRKLNTRTYKYYALRTFDGSPYAVPPMMAAFEMIEIEKDMIKNMRHIIKKLGLFGFLSVYVTAPTRHQGETQEAFTIRAAEYLNTIRPQIEKGFNSGTVVGFKGSQEFKMEGNTANVTGATEILDTIMQMKAAGIKQDPLMLGRNFNVAETMAKVIMAKLTTQIANVQRLVATVRADVYYMMLSLGGFKLKSVYVNYTPPMIGDKLREQQAEAALIDNVFRKRDGGIIGQQQAAQELDYDKPHFKKNVDYTVPIASDIAKKPNPSSDPAKTAATEGASNYVKDYFNFLRGPMPEYVYEAANTDCNHTHVMKYAKKPTDKIDDYVNEYGEALNVEYEKAIEEMAKQIGIALAEMGDGTTVDIVTDRIFYIIYNTWTTTFQKTNKAVVNKYTEEIYQYFRNDTSPFSSNLNPPTVHFNLHDIRTLEYFRNSDELYLGKFITDSDVRKKVTEYIKSKYIYGNEPIGNNEVAIQEFRDQFVELMHFESWKIRRIIDTTTNNMRNFGALAYIKQAELTQFQIQGISDKVQCSYCAYMDGMKFDVDKAYDRAERVVKSFPDFVKSEKPFITNVYGGKAGLSALTELDSEEIQGSGIDLPAYHPSCRCVIVAVQ